MRRLARRKAVTIIAAIISFTAIPAAGIVATATPALASVTICNTVGNMYCIGAPAIGFGDMVILTATGRQITEADQHFKCCGGHEVFQLQFTADTTRCVGAPTDGFLNATVRECSGGDSNFVNWAKEPQSNGSVRWFNNTRNAFLASDNTLGDWVIIANSCVPPCLFGWDN